MPKHKIAPGIYSKGKVKNSIELNNRLRFDLAQKLCHGCGYTEGGQEGRICKAGISPMSNIPDGAIGLIEVSCPRGPISP